MLPVPHNYSVQEAESMCVKVELPFLPSVKGAARNYDKDEANRLRSSPSPTAPSHDVSNMYPEQTQLYDFFDVDVQMGAKKNHKHL